MPDTRTSLQALYYFIKIHGKIVKMNLFCNGDWQFEKLQLCNFIHNAVLFIRQSSLQMFIIRILLFIATLTVYIW